MQNKKTYTDFIISELNKGIPSNGYYVYFILNKSLNKVIYIGKGKKDRVKFHFKNINKYLNNEIKRLVSLGYEIDYTIVKTFDLEKDAYDYETKLIKEALKNEIELINVSQTHKSLYLRKQFRDCLELINICINYYLGNNGKKADNILKSVVKSIFKKLKKEVLKYPKLKNKYFIYGTDVFEINNIFLGNRKIYIV
jgi:hypothetical protein